MPDINLNPFYFWGKENKNEFRIKYKYTLIVNASYLIAPFVVRNMSSLMANIGKFISKVYSYEF